MGNKKLKSILFIEYLEIIKKTFTLLELIMVMVIVGIIAVLTIPRFNVFYSIKLQSAGKKLISDIRYIQTVAITTKDDYSLTFDTLNNQYFAQRVSDSAFVIDPFTHQDLIVDFDENLRYQGVNINSVDFGGGNTLIFNWRGIPQDLNGTDLIVDGIVTLTYHGQTLTIRVIPQTGKVRAE
jgi:prepilin-type N-terminal cleavage/methylation domain-containing protein